MVKSKKYKITLLVQGNIASFTCDDPSETEKAWEDNKKICVNQPDGKRYFYDLTKYHTMFIEEIKE
jgi:hypothetical protein